MASKNFEHFLLKTNTKNLNNGLTEQNQTDELICECFGWQLMK